jgi:hypothetical protein
MIKLVDLLKEDTAHSLFNELYDWLKKLDPNKYSSPYHMLEAIRQKTKSLSTRASYVQPQRKYIPPDGGSTDDRPDWRDTGEMGG